MPGTPLTDFLIRLATDLDLLQTFNASVENARQLMTHAGLNDAQQNAVLSKNVSAIHWQLQQEGTHGEFVVPAGPVLDDRGRFTVGPQGVMSFEPPVLPSPMPVLRTGGGRPTEPPPPPPILPGGRGKPRRPARKPAAKTGAARKVKKPARAKQAKGKKAKGKRR